MPPALPHRSLLPGLVLTVLLGLVLPVLSAPAASAAETCTDTATKAHAVRVCLMTPENGAAVAGDVPVTARVQILRAKERGLHVLRVAFSYRDAYLLSDSRPEYGLTWRTTRLVDGPGVLQVRALLSDRKAATHSAAVTLANGVSAPWTNGATFRTREGTVPEPGERFRLVAVGDAAAGSPLEHRLADQIAGWKPNLLAYLGDVYERGSVDEFDNWYGSDLGFGRFSDITNPTVGNHEYRTPGAAGYFAYWDNIPHYYSYDVAGWHVVSLDSTNAYGGLRPGTPQYDWLDADLSANRAHCTLVYMHHPRFSLTAKEERGGLDAVWPLLAARRVTLMVAGHAHHYERWRPLNGDGARDPRGVTEIVSGAGGHELTPPVGWDSRVLAASSHPGAVRLDLGAEDAQVSYVDVNGAQRDSATIGCKSTGDPVPPTVPVGVQATVTDATTVQLSWEPSTDQYTSVAGYAVRRNGDVVARVEPGTTSFTSTGLVAGKTYSWTVDAFDTSDNHSAQSAPVAVTMPAPVAGMVSTQELLGTLPLRRETPKGFRSTRFRTWVDADGDRCNARNEVLLTESTTPPRVLPSCRVVSGRWLSAYDGVTTTNGLRVAVGPTVPYAEAWQSGAKRWGAARRTRFANDVGYAASLRVLTQSVLARRGSAEPQHWMPPQPTARCTYLAEWVGVKWRWSLGVDRRERRFLTRRLAACGWPLVEQPARL